jgi:hypothetical protein
MPRPIDTKAKTDVDWLRAPSRREPWRTTLHELVRPMTAEELEGMARETAGRSVLLDPGAEA